MPPRFRQLVVFFLLALCVSWAWADETTFVITPETRPRAVDLGAAERAYEDTTAKLTVDDVRALLPGKFLPLQKFPELRYSSAYWVRVAVKSELHVDMPYVLFATWWDYIDIYLLRADGSVTHLRSGLLKAPEDANDKFYPTLLIRPGETVTLLVRLASAGMFHTPDSLGIVLSQAASRHETVLPYFYIDGILFGMLFALSLYNLFVARSTGDRAYLLYSLYLLTLAIALMGQMGGSASKLNQIFMPDYPWLAVWIKRLSDPAAWILLMLFNRAFLETRRYLPAWDKLFIGVAVWTFVEFILFALGWEVDLWKRFSLVIDALYDVIAVAGIIAGVLRYRQGFTPAKYFVIAQVLLSIGLLLQTHGEVSWNPLHSLPSGPIWSYLKGNQLWLGAAAEAILFSMGLSSRINLLRATVARHALEREQERRRLATEHNDRLEVEVAERTQELRLEKENANHLLHNILPVEVADELIANGSTRPQHYDEATILFTDFVDFTKTVASLPADTVVAELNDMFRHFDDIIDACGIEKIKTIGDEYMIAGGLPKPQPDHAERCVDAALRMQAYLEVRNRTSSLKWSMRAGIHSGEVVAGVVGKKKFTYDVWGDTVNTASRMESAGEAGRVNVSASTFELIKARYQGEYRGKLDVKGKGAIDMYFVRS